MVHIQLPINGSIIAIFSIPVRQIHHRLALELMICLVVGRQLAGFRKIDYCTLQVLLLDVDQPSLGVIFRLMLVDLNESVVVVD